MPLLRIVPSEEINESNLHSYIPRMSQNLDDIKGDVINIIHRVKKLKDIAIQEYTKKFDKVELAKNQIKVSEQEIIDAYDQVDPQLLDAIKYAKKNIEKFHEAQLRNEWEIEIIKGVKAGQIQRPIESVGLYIPGGKAIYPSSVLMTAIPAIVAGVENMIMCSPPSINGNIASEILVAARECNIKDIFKVGGAQAIAAMAYGTEIIPPVQKIVGPGNKWVNAAKQLLSNVVAIDTPAGPSEILIIADKDSKIEYVIVDFISQIEHDPDNIGIVVSISERVLNEINNKISSYLKKSKRREIIESACKNSLLIKAKNVEAVIRITNLIAPEHLEIMVTNYNEIKEKILNAGAIFLGPYSPVPLGDYSAGTNHVLPTGGNAKKCSGLNVYDFLKFINVLECSEEGLEELSFSSSKLAEFEGLDFHSKAILERLKNKE